MSLDEVAKKVTEKSKLESDRIIKEGGKEALQIVSQADAEVKKLTAEARQKAERQIQLTKEQEMSSAEVEGRRNMLKAEREILEEVKAKTFEALTSAPKPKREQIIGHLIMQAGHVFQSGYVYSNSVDADYVKRSAKKYQFAGTIQCAGGIMVENSDKSERLDLTYETILGDLWQEKIGEVADILFK